jgi:hypothetical protein
MQKVESVRNSQALQQDRAALIQDRQQKAQQEAADRQEQVQMQAIVQQNGGDIAKSYPQLASINAEKADKYLKAHLDTAKLQGELDDYDTQKKVSVAGFVTKNLQDVEATGPDERQHAYDVARANIQFARAQMHLPPATEQDMPAVYDQARVAQMIQNGQMTQDVLGKQAKGEPTFYTLPSDPTPHLMLKTADGRVMWQGKDVREVAQPWEKPSKESATKVGSFEDYVTRTYGDNPTPAQILAARKAYGQADDRPLKSSVTVNMPTGATIEQMARGSGYTVEGLKKAARDFHESGVLPALGNRAQTKIAIQNAEALLYGGEGDTAMTRAGFKANSGALNALTKQLGAVQAYERTGLNNLKMFTDLAKNIPDTGVPWLNTPLRALSANVVGSENMAAINAARQVALTEISKVVNNPNLSGALSDSARNEVLGLIPENATFGQIKRVAQVLQRDMANRPSSMKQEIDRIKYEMAHPGETAPAASDPLTVQAPNGKTYKFTSPEKAAAFKKAAGIS